MDLECEFKDVTSSRKVLQGKLTEPGMYDFEPKMSVRSLPVKEGSSGEFDGMVPDCVVGSSCAAEVVWSWEASLGKALLR